MKNLLIYGASKDYSPALLDQALAALVGACPPVACNIRIILTDRYGLDAEIARLCQRWHIPFTVFGTAARPRNGVSLAAYERLHICPVNTSLDNLLNRHLMALAQVVLVLGSTPDCQAMRLWAKLCRKPAPLTFAQRAHVHDALIAAKHAAATTKPTADIPNVPKVIMPLDRQIAVQRFLVAH